MEKHSFKKLISHKRAHYLMIALVFFCASVFVFWLNHSWYPVASSSSSVSDVIYERDPLTGVLSSEVVAHKQIYAVMIDGHVDAQPMSGIDQAFLVIEASVEAGIPRRLAFFSEDQSVKKIGSVRSARPYFIDWANELDALYVHVGGSDAALEKIATGITFDLNQFWHGDQFWRDTRRNAPHNVFTSTDLLGVYVNERRAMKRVSEPLYGTWKFLETDGAIGTQTSIPISYGSPEYDFIWVLDVEKKNYVREQNRKPVLTSDNQEIRAENVAIIETTIEMIDRIGRRKIKTIGNGRAQVFQNGKVMEGQWKKESQTDRLTFIRDDGSEIEMLPGKTWIEVQGSVVSGE